MKAFNRTAKSIQHTTRFIIQGRKKLEGIYPVQGNKNAALPILCASLLAPERVILKRVPDILDVHNLLHLVQSLDVETRLNQGQLILDVKSLRNKELPEDIVRKLRGAILLLGALAPRSEQLICPKPGGCVIGLRSLDVHWQAFRAAGFRIRETDEVLEVSKEREVGHPTVFLEEASVTATENALILFAAQGGGTVYNPAREPHVFALVEFLEKLGCEVERAPLHLTVHSGVNCRQNELHFEIPGDYIDAGTIGVAASLCNGEIEIQGIGRSEMVGIEPVLKKFGVSFEWVDSDRLRVAENYGQGAKKVTAGPWPLFPTDLTSLAIVLATQRSGTCLIHDWMYEGRMFFVDKLIRMGANITMCDPHRVLVTGPSRLQGKVLESPDIRAGMAMVIAGLIAESETVIEHSEVIKRGYEHIVPRLSGLGASIQEG